MNNNEYFLVNHSLSINVLPVTKEQLPENEIAFEQEIPGPFKMASDLAKADASILTPLKLSSDNTQALWHYLQAQNQKINTLLSYVLTQQDDPTSRYQTIKFSAGNLIINLPSFLKLADNVRLKIFLPDESAAIYCYAEVVEIDQSHCDLRYTLIREEDRELLIRASLHVQSQQLKNRALQRDLKA